MADVVQALEAGPLPPHPEEQRLRRQEDEAADTVRQVSTSLTTALRQHDRGQALAYATQLSLMGEGIRRAMVQATRDQMAVSNGGA